MRKSKFFLKAFLISGILLNGMNAHAQKEKAGEQLPTMPEMPSTPTAKAENTVAMGNSNSFTEAKLDLPISDGPFKPTWASIEANYPGEPAWFRKAKFGIWVHFGPQSAGESGDWYARKLYYEGSNANNNHKKRFGHPSKVGYKDVLNSWNPTKLNPEYLTKLYKKAGARFLMIQGVHHDNYDLWNSQYQPWNSVNIGPKRDLLAEWVKACKEEDMRYGVTFHHEYTWWWWQTAFGSDKSGEYAGVPYDGSLTLEDGKGKWWEGYDPRLLYGINLREYKTVAERANEGWSPPDAGIFTRHLDYCKWYAKQWALRMMDVVANYDPDFIYTDGTVQGPFTGAGTGTGYKCDAMQRVMADYYNRTLKNRGEVNTFAIIKFRKPTNGTVNTAEFDFPEHIDTSQPWIREAPVGDWFYSPGFTYDAGSMIRFIIEAISRDGNAALNIPMRPDGSIENACVTMLEKVGEWMDINGRAVYGSKAWKTLGEGEIVNGKLKTLPGGGLGRQHKDFKFSPQDIRFTVGEDGLLYAFTMEVPKAGSVLSIKSLGLMSEYYGGKVEKVTLLGHGDVEFDNDINALNIHIPSDISSVTSAVFAININPGVIETPKLQDVINLYENKVNDVKPLASYNTGKWSIEAVAEMEKAIAEAKTQIGNGESAEKKAIKALTQAFDKFEAEGINQGGKPLQSGAKDITVNQLVQASNFAAKNMGARFGTPVNWTVENAKVPQKDSSKGAKNGIDNFPGFACLYLGVWSGEDTSTPSYLKNARIYRKVHLKAGQYYFGASYNALNSVNDEAYIFASDKVVNTSDIPAKSIAYDKINMAKSDGTFRGINFILDKEQDVFLGFQMNLLLGSGTQEFRAKGVKLLYYETPTNVQDVTERPAASDISESPNGYYTIDGQYLGYDNSKLSKGIYLHEGKKIAIK